MSPPISLPSLPPSPGFYLHPGASAHLRSPVGQQHSARLGPAWPARRGAADAGTMRSLPPELRRIVCVCTCVPPRRLPGCPRRHTRLRAEPCWLRRRLGRRRRGGKKKPHCVISLTVFHGRPSADVSFSYGTGRACSPRESTCFVAGFPRRSHHMHPPPQNSLSKPPRTQISEILSKISWGPHQRGTFPSPLAGF